MEEKNLADKLWKRDGKPLEQHIISCESTSIRREEGG